jgi:transposase
MDGGFIMSKKVFSADQIAKLEKNPNIIRVVGKQITYHPDFKLRAVLENIKGKSPADVFVANGFDLELIGKDIPRKRLYNWRKIYEKLGELGFSEENRGRTRITPSSSSKTLSLEEQLKRAEAKINFLEAENEFLKKLEDLERQAMRRKHY